MDWAEAVLDFWSDDGGSRLYLYKGLQPPKVGNRPSASLLETGDPKDCVIQHPMNPEQIDTLTHIEGIGESMSEGAISYLEEIGANTESMLCLYLKSGQNIPGLSEKFMEAIRKKYLDEPNLPDFSKVDGVGTKTSERIEEACVQDGIETKDEFLSWAETNLEDVSGIGSGTAQNILDAIRGDNNPKSEIDGGLSWL